MAIDSETEKTGDLANTKVQTGHSAFKWALVLLPFGYLWFRLINNLRLEWATNPQYSYGWVVPLLCVGLLVKRWHAARDHGLRTTHQEEQAENLKANTLKLAGKSPEAQFRFFSFSAFQLFIFALAFLYLPTRLIEASTPEWRPIQWSLGVVAIGLTLCAIYIGRGRGWLKELAFPVSFLFVAIPWPTLFEQPIIQGLTRWNTAMVIEVMGVLGVPALQHGNVIEVGTGVVGIDEACSGIRSFQSSIMISLFLGEFYRLNRSRRLLLVLIGFLMAFGFNVCRTSMLTYVAAKQGIAAISQYHDPAGLAILLACTAGMWLIAVLMKRQKSEIGGQKSETRGRLPVSRPSSPDIEPPSALRSLTSVLCPLTSALLIWLIVVEIGVQAWYRSREAHFVPSPSWSLVFPEGNPTFRATPVGEKEKYLLRFDEAKQGAWQEADGTRWEAFYFNWFPGRVAGYLAKRHTPEACLPASGWKMRLGPELMVLKVKDIQLPMRHYVFGDPGNSLQVFQCRWEDGMGKDAYVQHETARFNLVRGIWAGRGVHGQKVLEFIISGCEDSEQAKAALVRQLQKLIKVGN